MSSTYTATACPHCGTELLVSHYISMFNTCCHECGGAITAFAGGVMSGHRAPPPAPRVTWMCEWCSPSDVPATHPEQCAIRWCATHQAETWHYPAARGEAEPAPDPATHIRVDGGQRWIPREG